MHTYVLKDLPVEKDTGLKCFPFKTKPVQRLHWEDRSADHLVTHEVQCINEL